jgi:excisionase family DNA binding protein
MSQTVINAEVLNLEEAATYLRVPKATVVRMVSRQGLPGRRLGREWRFLKKALDNWLCRPTGKDVLLRQAGALADDPSLPNLLKEIYANRGRSEVEDR